MNTLDVINGQLASYEAQRTQLNSEADALARTPARTRGERDTQMQLLEDYSRRIGEIDIKISCIQELVSVIVAATPSTSGVVPSAA